VIGSYPRANSQTARRIVHARARGAETKKREQSSEEESELNLLLTQNPSPSDYRPC